MLDEGDVAKTFVVQIPQWMSLCVSLVIRFLGLRGSVERVVDGSTALRLKGRQY